MPEVAGRKAGGENHRDAVGIASAWVFKLDTAIAGRAGGGVGDRGIDQPRDGAPNTQKNGMTGRKIDYWVIPPQADAEFVASMEEVLDTYAEPYDPKYPKLAMDEQPIQLLKETRIPIAATKEHPRRVDY